MRIALTADGLDVLGGSLGAGALMALGALIIGFSKTSLGGLAAVAIAIFATVMPAKESTAAILAILIIGDLVAVWHYRRDADWAIIRALLPAVLPGLVLGTWFLSVVDDTTLRRTIGATLLGLLLVQLVLKRRASEETPALHHGTSSAQRTAAAWGAGAATGFATMTANAAGAVMTLYLSASGVDKRRFVGTIAWLFLVVNLAKVPFSVGLGLMEPTDLVRAAVLAPLVLAGGIAGYATIQRISQRTFDVAVLAASAVAAAALLLR